MPARSKAQKRLMSWALGVKKGKAKGAPASIKRLAKGMTAKELEKYTETDYSKLPERIKETMNVKTFESFIGEDEEMDDIEIEMDDDMDQEDMENAEDMDDVSDMGDDDDDDDDEDEQIISIKSSHPMKRKHAPEWSEPESKMMEYQLRNILENAEELLNLVSGMEEVEDWVQSKITLVDDYISTIRDYIKHRD